MNTPCASNGGPLHSTLFSIDLHCGKHYYNERIPVLHNQLSVADGLWCAGVTGTATKKFGTEMNTSYVSPL